MRLNQAVFIFLFVTAMIFFARNCYRRFSLIWLGKPADRFRPFFPRVRAMLVYAFGQRRVVTRLFGLNHFVIFWSFLILLAANGEFLLHGLFPAISLSLLPSFVYLPVSFLFETVSLITLISMIVSLARRALFPPPYLTTPYVKARSFEAFLILGFITLLMLAFFGLHSVEIALGKTSAGSARPVSSLLAGSLAGISPPGLELLGGICWWLHALVLLAFFNVLPLSKHMHIMTAIPNCFFRDLEQPALLPREVFSKGNIFGAGRVDDFSWKDLFDSYSCTECGRCQDACPATNTQKPLNPRQVIHAIKINLLANGPALKAGVKAGLPLIGDNGEGSNPENALWSCTTCGACLEVCPVLIEHVPKIIQMRRHLVEMESKFPEELYNLFENLEQRHNPWGIAPAERSKWTAGLEIKQFAAGETEYLYFVGCAGAFDPRNKQVTLAVATILNAAGISWGILGKEERCCGDSLRRLGNEFLFEKTAQENARIFREKGVRKIVTQCPHCFHTLKNDYRQYGLELEVIHHSELILRLWQDEKIRLVSKAQNPERIVFHDSCYLGRHNGIYHAPRQVIRLATGTVPAEMKRNRENSFCCGAGGGRMWMEESLGTRINLARVQEALARKPDILCVACPYCMTMFEDGLKDEKAENVRVRDIAEIAVSGLG